MLTPRAYISFSQLSTFEMSKEKYVEQYLHGAKNRISRNISLGSKMADGLEAGEFSGDPLLDLVMSRLPKLDRADKPVEDPKGFEVVDPYDKKTYRIPVLKNGKEQIPLLAKVDSASNDYSKMLEYKTSTRRWTQKTVDESGQITFYATAIWLTTGKIPQEIELIQAQTAYDADGRLYVTGEIFRFPTKRTMIDVIKMVTRIKKAWRGIQELCEKELL